MIVVRLNKQFKSIEFIIKRHMQITLKTLNVDIEVYKDILFSFDSRDDLFDISDTHDIHLAHIVYKCLLSFDTVCKQQL